MPVTYRPRTSSRERTFQTLLDWTRRIMQLASLALIGLYGYMLYGLLFGDVGQWGSLDAANRARIGGIIQSATFYASVALGVLVVTACILYYDEETLGYTLVAATVFFYFGVPFIFSYFLQSQLDEWNQTKNTAALAIYSQLRTAGLILSIPGGILVLRDLIVRTIDGSRRKREVFSALQYGGSVREQAPVGKAPIGMLAKCWQLPYCRDAIRVRCPIYHARTRCWRERVGCMCEENVIRNAMDALINKQIIQKNGADDDPIKIDGGGKEAPLPVGVTIGEGAAAQAEVAEKTEEHPRRPFVPPHPRHVKIPHNPNLPMAAKVERCRNCVIYNEHQRLKYQFFAPLVVLAVPALAYLEIDPISQTLDNLLHRIDEIMAHLSLTAGAKDAGIMSSLTSTSAVAKYIVIGCLVVIATTMAVRALEYLVFKLKI